MEKLYFSLAFCLCFCMAAPQDRYAVTAPELDRLEQISKNWQDSNQKQAALLTDSQATVRTLQGNLKTLRELYRQEQATLGSLRKSFDEYATDQSIKLATAKTQLREERGAKEKWRAGCIKAWTALGALAAAAAIWLYIKIKH